MSETILCNFPERLTNNAPPSIFDLGLAVAATVMHGNQMSYHGLGYSLHLGGLECLLYITMYAPCVGYPQQGI